MKAIAKGFAALLILSTVTACSGVPLPAPAASGGSTRSFPVGTQAEPNLEACATDFFAGTPPRLTNAKLASQTRPLCFSEYAVLHSGVTRTPLWAGEHLTYSELMMDIDRKDNFHAEPALPVDERSELADYVGSGYDRGHMAPVADMPTEQAMSESFSLANITPQNPSNNRGLWSSLESKTRNLALQRGDLYVVSGAVFAGASLSRINNRVLVPSHYFKAVYDEHTGESGAYWVSNDANKTYKVLSIAELTQLAGIDAFPAISTYSKNTAMALP